MKAYGFGFGFSFLKNSGIILPVPLGFNYTPPFSVIKKGAQYTVPSNFNLKTYANVTGGTTYYVDETNGSDSNTGLSWAQAWKTLSKVESTGGYGTVYCKGYFYKNQRPTAFTSNINLICPEGETATITADISNTEGSWSEHAEGVYTTVITGTVTQLRDYALPSENYIDYSLYTLAASLIACETTPNTWFQSGADIYIHTFDDREPDADIKIYDGVAYSSTQNNRVEYFENITFENVANFYPLSATGGHKVYFQSCNVYAVVAHGLDEIINKDCFRLVGGEDGFNYDVASTLISKYNNINLRATNRNTGTSSGQASTSHNGCVGVVVGGEYYDTSGQNIADVNAGQTWVAGAYLHGSAVDVGAYFSVDKVWMEGCTISDNTTSIQLVGAGNRLWHKNNILSGTNNIESGAYFFAYETINSVVDISISGPAMVGGTLTATPGTWVYEGTAVKTYQWTRDNVPIVGETGLTYEIVLADLDAYIDCIEIVTITETGLSNSQPSNNKLVTAFTPADNTSQVIWYRGDAGVTLSGAEVTHWANQYALSRTLTPTSAGTRPTILAVNGINALDFDGGDSIRNETGGIFDGTTGLTIHMAIKMPTELSNACLLAITNTAGGGKILVYQKPTGAPNTGVDAAVRRVSTDTLVYAGDSSYSSAVQIISVAIDFSAGTYTVYLNGVASGAGTISTTGTSDSGSAAGRIYVMNNNGSNRVTGQCCEIIGVSELQDSDEIALNVGWLQRWQ